MAEQQLGVIRRDQVLKWLSPGQLERRVRAKSWQALLTGVYRIPGAPRNWLQDLRALALWADKNYAFSHETAAALLGFARFKAKEKLVLSVTRHLPTPVIPDREKVELHRVRAFGAKDRWTVQAVQVTSPTRTLLDLGSTTTTNEDLRATVDEALRRQMTTVEKLAIAVHREKKAKERPHGLTFLRTLVHEYQGGDGPCESEFESLVLELLLGSGLPRPNRQHPIKVAGRFRRLDFFFDAHGVILEADGYAYHSDTVAFEKDRQRHNSLTARGFLVIHWTWKGIKGRPGELLEELGALLARRVGWKLLHR